MAENSHLTLGSFAEKAYVRLQAEELIAQCLQELDLSLLDQLLEGLVLDGASSMAVMREILEEIRSTRIALSRDGMHAREDLIAAFLDFEGVLPKVFPTQKLEDFRLLRNRDFIHLARRGARSLAMEDEVLLAEICRHVGEQVEQVAVKMNLLRYLEEAVLDWYSGLAYQASQQVHVWGFESHKPEPDRLH